MENVNIDFYGSSIMLKYQIKNTMNALQV